MSTESPQKNAVEKTLLSGGADAADEPTPPNEQNPEREESPQAEETPQSVEQEPPEDQIPTEQTPKEILRQQVSETVGRLEENLSLLPALSRMKEEDIPAILETLQRIGKRDHRNVPEFLRAIKRELWVLSEKKRITRESGMAFGGFVNQVLEITVERERGASEKEAAELMAKPISEILEMLEEKTEKRQPISQNLLLVAIDKSKQFLDSRIQAEVKSGQREATGEEAEVLAAGPIMRGIKSLAFYRNFGEEILQHLGSGALEVVAEISRQERELRPVAGERFGVIEAARQRMHAYEGLISRIFREEPDEGEETPPNEELENLKDAAELYGIIGRHLKEGLETRPGYNFQFFSRLLLEFLLRRNELKGAIPPETINALTARANRIAAFTNRKKYLDLSRMLKSGELNPPVLRSLKAKMFLDVYPDVWSGYEAIRDQYGEMAKSFVGKLAQIHSEAASFEASARRVIDAEQSDIDEVVGFEDVLRDVLTEYGMEILALREAYEMGDKVEGGKMELLISRLQRIRGKKRIFRGGRRAVREGRGVKTTDERLRHERNKLKGLEKQRRKLENMAGEEGVEDTEEQIKLLKGIFGEGYKKMDIKAVEREIGWAKRNIARLQNKRTTERDTKESEYKIERYAGIADALSREAKSLRSNQPVREVIDKLTNTLLEV